MFGGFFGGADASASSLRPERIDVSINSPSESGDTVSCSLARCDLRTTEILGSQTTSILKKCGTGIIFNL